MTWSVISKTLYHNIIINPDDIAVRLAFADSLMENEEHDRFDEELAMAIMTNGPSDNAEARFVKLTVKDYQFHYGFIDEVTVTVHQWYSYGPLLVRAQPIKTVKVNGNFFDLIRFDPIKWAWQQHVYRWETKMCSWCGATGKEIRLNQYSKCGKELYHENSNTDGGTSESGEIDLG